MPWNWTPCEKDSIRSILTQIFWGSLNKLVVYEQSSDGIEVLQFEYDHLAQIIYCYLIWYPKDRLIYEEVLRVLAPSLLTVINYIKFLQVLVEDDPFSYQAVKAALDSPNTSGVNFKLEPTIPMIQQAIDSSFRALIRYSNPRCGLRTPCWCYLGCRQCNTIPHGRRKHTRPFLLKALAHHRICHKPRAR